MAETANVLERVRKHLLENECTIRTRHLPVRMDEKGVLTPYKGINILNLWISAGEGGFSSSVWGSAAHLKALTGCPVRRGERASRGVYAGFQEVAGKAETEEEGAKDDAKATEIRRVYRTFPLFNTEQLEGVRIAGDRLASPPPSRGEALSRIKSARARLEEEEASMGIAPLKPEFNLAVDNIALCFFRAAIGERVLLRLDPEVVANATIFSRAVGCASRCFFEGIEMSPAAMRLPEVIEAPVATTPALASASAAAASPTPSRGGGRSRPSSEPFNILAWYGGMW